MGSELVVAEGTLRISHTFHLWKAVPPRQERGLGVHEDVRNESSRASSESQRRKFYQQYLNMVDLTKTYTGYLLLS